MSTDYMNLSVRDEPALIVTTGRNEAFIFADSGPRPEVTGLGAAVLVTRLRWWADEIECAAYRDKYAPAARACPDDPADVPGEVSE